MRDDYYLFNRVWELFLKRQQNNIAQDIVGQPKSLLEWAASEYTEHPFRLKYVNPTTLPRRWQTHMR